MRRLLFFYLIGQSLCFAGITEKKNELGPPLTLSVGDSLHLSNHIEKLSKKKNSNSIVVNMICHKKKKEEILGINVHHLNLSLSSNSSRSTHCPKS